MNNFVKRSLCVLCALLVAFTFAVRPHAVVGVDDVLLAGTSAVALLFLSWCGITFGTNADAVAGVQAYLENTVDGAKRLAAIAEQYVSDGTLKMTAAVKSAFTDLKDGIREFFQTPEDSYTGSLAGSVCAGVPYSLLPYNKGDPWLKNDVLRFPVAACIDSLVIWFESGYIKAESQAGSSNTILWNAYNLDGTKHSNVGNYNYNISGFYDFTKAYYSNCIYIWSSGDSGANRTYLPAPGNSWLGSFVSLQLTKGLIGFTQDKIVDGSSALKILEPVELPDPTPGQDPDPEQKPKEFTFVPMEEVIKKGLFEGTDAEGNPGLDPDKLVEALRKLRYGCRR